MKKIIFVLLNWYICISIQAQQKQFDIFSFTPPANYQLKEQQQRIVYERTEGNTFCQIHLWPVQQGTADPQANFKTDWDHFAGNHYKTGDPKEKQTLKLGDWYVVTGVAVATVEGMPFIISVSTFTQNNLSWCIITQFNDEKYTTDVDAFVGSIITDVKKLKKINSPQQQPANLPTPSQNDNNTISNSGITKSTTTFDDGWTSSITNNFVKVFKNGTEVWLYYVDTKVDQQRPSNTNTFEGYYWNAIVKTVFNTGQAIVREKEQYSYGKEDIWEASVTNKQTGKNGYLGMRLVFRNGACLPIVVIAPDKNSYYSLFGSDEDFTKMLNYNKFAVTQKDLAGIWKSFQANSIGYYNIYTGDYAGMASASTNDEFVFNNNGSYQSTHTGTSTFNGSLSHGKSIYKGIYNVTDWNMTTTNRGANDPGEFSCQFEAVKGGCLLRLTNKKFTGDHITLYKSK